MDSQWSARRLRPRPGRADPTTSKPAPSKPAPRRARQKKPAVKAPPEEDAKLSDIPVPEKPNRPTEAALPQDQDKSAASDARSPRVKPTLPPKISASSKTMKPPESHHSGEQGTERPPVSFGNRPKSHHSDEDEERTEHPPLPFNERPKSHHSDERGDEHPSTSFDKGSNSHYSSGDEGRIEALILHQFGSRRGDSDAKNDERPSASFDERPKGHPSDEKNVERPDVPFDEKSNSLTDHNITPVPKPGSQFAVQLTVDTPLEDTVFMETPSLHMAPRRQVSGRPVPERATFLETTPLDASIRRGIARQGPQLSASQGSTWKRCIARLFVFLGLMGIWLGLLLIHRSNDASQFVGADEEILLPIHQPIIDLSNVLMGFSPVSTTENILIRSRTHVDNICQGPRKWEELRNYPGPPPGKEANPRRVRARKQNMTSLVLPGMNNDEGMIALVNKCKDVEQLIEAVSYRKQILMKAQKTALEDTVQVIEEIYERITTTIPQGDEAQSTKGGFLSWLRPAQQSKSLIPWQYERQVANRYLVSLDKLGKDITSGFTTITEIPTSTDLLSYKDSYQDDDFNPPMGEKVPIWRRWLRHPLGSSLELSFLFKNASMELDKITRSIEDIERYMWDLCDDKNSKTHAGCPYVWPPSAEARPTIDLENYSHEARGRARKIAAALEWIDLERRVLRTLLGARDSKGPGLLNGKCEVMLDDTGKMSGGRSSTRGWIHRDPMVSRGQAFSTLPLCAATRVFRPALEKFDCKAPGSEDFWDGVRNMMGHTFGMASRADDDFPWVGVAEEDTNSVSHEARDLIWKHELSEAQKSSVWSQVVEGQSGGPIFPSSTPVLYNLRLPLPKEQEKSLNHIAMQIRIFLWNYL